ncbi:MAG TPA: type II toxin-antitoxin system prevent-host-death family antitoxin [Vineibacter sp.]|nr:type II toxin-antitoxin system prevent-host-death family antitoxin [Vineibacter sp.]
MGKPAEKTIAVSAFKPRSLAIIDEVASRKVDRVVLTRRGKPVAAIVPVAPEPRIDLWGAMRGSVTIAPGVDITKPTGEVWDAERDD